MSEYGFISTATSQNYIQRQWHVWKVTSRYNSATNERTFTVYRDGTEVTSGTDSRPLGPGAFGFATDYSHEVRIDWAKLTTYSPTSATACSASSLPVSNNLAVHASPVDQLLNSNILFDQSVMFRTINLFDSPTIERNAWRNTLDALEFDGSSHYAEVPQQPITTTGWTGVTAYVVVRPQDLGSACYLCAGFASDTSMGWGIRSEGGAVRIGAVSQLGSGRRAGIYTMGATDITKPSVFTIRVRPGAS